MATVLIILYCADTGVEQNKESTDGIFRMNSSFDSSNSRAITAAYVRISNSYIIPEDSEPDRHSFIMELTGRTTLWDILLKIVFLAARFAIEPSMVYHFSNSKFG